ncbi:MAG: hypothetical protein IKU83_05700 [Lachnospiraceae bacterium]|nr:hypothetical protein [Lachnospiraceae bacterium]
MKKIRWIVCIVFVLSCILFGVFVARTKMTEDKVAPTISCDTDTLTVSVKATMEELLQGVTAQDAQDGDLTADIRVASLSNFVSKNTRTIKYVVFDKVNNAATIERTLVYSDYRAPRIYLSKPFRVAMAEAAVVKPADYVYANDCLDGDITSSIRYGLTLTTLQTGAFPASFQVNNKAGDTCVIEVELEVVDSSTEEERAKYYPVLSEYVVYTSVGDSIDPALYLRGLEHRGSRVEFDETVGLTREQVVIEDHVQVSRAGTYQVRYTYTTPEGVAATTKLYVVVEE